MGFAPRFQFLPKQGLQSSSIQKAMYVSTPSWFEKGVGLRLLNRFFSFLSYGGVALESPTKKAPPHAAIYVERSYPREGRVTGRPPRRYNIDWGVGHSE